MPEEHMNKVRFLEATPKIIDYTAFVQWIGYDATNVGMVVRFHHAVPSFRLHTAKQFSADNGEVTGSNPVLRLLRE